MSAARGEHEGKPSNRVAEIVDVAGRLFAERGFSGTSTRDVASACGLNIATVAHHVGSKADLYARVFDHIQQIELDRIGPAVLAELNRLDREPAEVTASVLRLVDLYLDLLDEQPHIGSLWLRRLIDKDESGESVKPDNPNTVLYQLFRDRIATAVELGAVRDADLEMMLRGFVWMAYARLCDDPVDGAGGSERFRRFIHDYVHRLLDPPSGRDPASQG